MNRLGAIRQYGKTLPFILTGMFLLIPASENRAGNSEGLTDTSQNKVQFSQASEASTDTVEGARKAPQFVPGPAPDFQADTLKGLSASRTFRSQTFMKAIFKWFGRLQPDQGGSIWISIIVIVLVAFDFKKIISRRNADVLLLLLPGFLLIDLINLGGVREFKDPAQKSLLGIVFLGIMLVSILFLIRALVGAYQQNKERWCPNLPKNALILLVVILFLLNALLAFGRFPDDCGVYTNIGAERMLETGKFPYGDSKLRGGAAATYGPVLYLAHIPFQLILKPFNFKADSDVYSFGSWVVNGGRSKYRGPPVLATKLAMLMFHILAIAGLIIIGRRLGGDVIGWGLAAIYVGSAFVHGLGGDEYYISGMPFISHIAPAAVTILAFAMIDKPLWSGVLLAVAVGVLFYPAFLFPLWLGYYFWQRKEWSKFVIGFGSVLVVMGALVLLLTQAGENESVFKVIYESTVGHQEAKYAYGSSTFSFWGTHPEIANIFQTPFVEGWYLLRPSFLIFFLFLIGTFFMVRNRNLAQFAFLTAAVVIAIQLWKSHAGGTYVEWYFPFFIIGLFAHQKFKDQMQPVPETTD